MKYYQIIYYVSFVSGQMSDFPKISTTIFPSKKIAESKIPIGRQKIEEMGLDITRISVLELEVVDETEQTQTVQAIQTQDTH